MVDLTRMSKFSTPNRRMSFSQAKFRAEKPRNNRHIEKGGMITQNYLGFNVHRELDGANATSNAKLLTEVAGLEQKTVDMGIAAEALQRKATQLAEQAVLKSDTLKHCLSEAAKLGTANNQANTAVVEFLNKMGIQHQKTDNKEALSSMQGEMQFKDTQTSFANRVRELYQGQQQKAIDYERQQRMREAAQRARTLQNWQNGKVDTARALEAYQEMQAFQPQAAQSPMFSSLKRTLGSVFN